MTDDKPEDAASSAPDASTVPSAETATNDQAPAEPHPSAATTEADETTGKAAAPDEDTGDDPAEGEKPKRKGGFQKRIDKLTQEKYEAELRAQQFQRALEQVRKQQQDAAGPGPEPKLETFTTVEDWQKAHKEWASKSGFQEGYTKAREEILAEQKRQEEISAIASLNAREDVARAKYADYDRMVDPIASVVTGNPTLTQYMMESEASAEVAYHLAKNPATLIELTRMTPVTAIRELAKLEARLSAPPPPKPVTKAPPPISPVGSRESAKVTLADLASKNTADYIALRNKQEMGKAAS